MFFIRKNLVLQGQVYPRRIDQVNDRQLVFDSNFLGAQVLFGSDREPGTGFHGGIISNNNALPARYIAYSAYYSS